MDRTEGYSTGRRGYLEGARLEECQELVDAKSRLPDDRAKRSAVEFLVVGHGNHRRWRVTDQDDVAPTLARPAEPDPHQCVSAFSG